MVQQYKAFWSIPNAGPSVSTFHASTVAGSTSQQWADRVRALFVALASTLPDEVSITFDTEVTTIDQTTGVLTGSTGVTPGGAVTGTATDTWSAGAGARIVWGTDDIFEGRRIRGATFIVPISGSGFDTSGRVSSGVVTGFGTAANAYLTGNDSDGTTPQVYSRPRPGIPGRVYDVTTASVPSLAATLRGRKY